MVAYLETFAGGETRSRVSFAGRLAQVAGSERAR